MSNAKKNGPGCGIREARVGSGIDGDYGRSSRGRKHVVDKANTFHCSKAPQLGNHQINHCRMNMRPDWMSLFRNQNIILRMKMIQVMRARGDFITVVRRLTQVRWWMMGKHTLTRSRRQ